MNVLRRQNVSNNYNLTRNRHSRTDQNPDNFPTRHSERGEESIPTSLNRKNWILRYAQNEVIIFNVIYYIYNLRPLHEAKNDNIFNKISSSVIPAKAGIHFNQSLIWIPAFAPQALRFAKR